MAGAVAATRHTGNFRPGSSADQMGRRGIKLAPGGLVVIRRLSLAALASLILLAAARPARAQDGGIGGALAPGDFFIGIQRENMVNLTDFEVERFFNKANCDC